MPSGSLSTPIGFVTVAAAAARIGALHIGGTAASDDTADSLVREALAQLGAWFGGRLDTFDLPLAPARTPRGQALRDAIAAVPRGQTASYGAVARAAGSSPRALGQACAQPVPHPGPVPPHRRCRGRAGPLFRRRRVGDEALAARARRRRSRRWLI